MLAGFAALAKRGSHALSRRSAVSHFWFLLIISAGANQWPVATPPDRPAAPAAVSLEEVEAVFQALAHPVRRHVILLLSHLGGELSSGYLAARFQHSWPTTTRHLKVLEKAGLVAVRREGRSSHYCLDRDRLERVVSGWLRQVTPVGPDQTWRSTGPRSVGELTRDARTSTGTRPPRPPRKKGDLP